MEGTLFDLKSHSNSIGNSWKAVHKTTKNGVKKGCRAMKVSLQFSNNNQRKFMVDGLVLIFNNQLTQHGNAQHAEIKITQQAKDDKSK